MFIVIVKAKEIFFLPRYYNAVQQPEIVLTFFCNKAKDLTASLMLADRIQ